MFQNYKTYLGFKTSILLLLLASLMGCNVLEHSFQEDNRQVLINQQWRPVKCYYFDTEYEIDSTKSIRYVVDTTVLHIEPVLVSPNIKHHSIFTSGTFLIDFYGQDLYKNSIPISVIILLPRIPGHEVKGSISTLTKDLMIISGMDEKGREFRLVCHAIRK